MERTGRSHMGCFDSKYKRNRNSQVASREKSREQRHFAPGTHPTSTLHAPPCALVPKKNAVTVIRWRRTVGRASSSAQRNGASLMA
jgi:hypothetical protein